MSNSAALSLARWEVLWLKNGKVLRKDCGTDFAEAQRLYTKVVQAGKSGATLRCKNVGFPPPDKYYRKPVIRIEKVGRKRIKHRVYVSVMGQLNIKGIWWCAYCCQMRRFAKRKGRTVDGVYLPFEHMACPVCGVTHENFWIKRYNPLAQRIAAAPGRMSNPNRRAEARERRRRRKQQQQEG